MLKIGEADADGVVTIHADGVVSREDYDRAVPEFEALLSGHDRLRFLIDLVGVTGWRIGAAWRDLGFSPALRRKIGRTAIIGDIRWRDWAAMASTRFHEGDVRYFSPSQQDQAREWLRG